MERVKKIFISLVLLMLFISIPTSARVMKLKTTAYSDNIYNYYTNRWSGWSDWQPSNMLIVIDTKECTMVIYSPVTQIYKIYKSGSSYYDSEGNLNSDFKVIDQEADRGKLHFIKRISGDSEIYIEFLDIIWGYKVVTL